MDSFVTTSYDELNTTMLEDITIPNTHEHTCCIDATNLTDESDQSIIFVKDYKINSMPTVDYYPPCASNNDISPNDSSGSNGNDDSLEQEDPNLLSSTRTTDNNQSHAVERECATSTPNNSIISHLSKDLDRLELSSCPYTYTQESSEKTTSILYKINNNTKSSISGGSSIENPMSSISRSPLFTRRMNEITPIPSGHVKVVEEIKNKPAKATTTASAWVVDMSDSENTSSKIALHPTSADENTEKKNIFSMFIGLDDKSTAVKEMPVCLSSSLISKKKTEAKNAKTKVTKEKCAADTYQLCCDSYTETFEHLEVLCKDPNLSITNIIKDHKQYKSTPNSLVSEAQIVSEEAGGLYVKLSDLDKPIKADHASTSSQSHTSSNKESNAETMSTSNPNNDWRESGQSNNLCDNLFSSFHSENALSLNRLFPNLKNDFSRSLPGSLSNSRSPARLEPSSSNSNIEEQPTDDSESSYVKNCTEKSSREEMAKLIRSCKSRLGQDLLRMFEEEIAPDVIIEAAGRRIKAHKCILSSRCQYFAGILSGRWITNSGNVITMPKSYSYNVVHFALCHIYSGISTIPENLNVTELLTLADMLGLEGLKEAISAKLKVQYCHNFHKPCPVCKVGVMECFPIAVAFTLEDITRKILKWIVKHFEEIWPTKTFGTMPGELQEKCFQEQVLNLSIENICQTVIGAGKIMACLHSNRWSMNVRVLCERLLNAATLFAASRLEQMLRATAHTCDLSPVAEVILDDFITRAIERAPPAETCRTYSFLSGYKKNDSPVNLLECYAERWLEVCEGALVAAAPSVVATQAYRDLSREQRKTLREIGCIMVRTTASPKPRRNNVRRLSPTSRDIELVRSSFVPYSPKPRAQLTMSEPRPRNTSGFFKNNTVRTTKAQEEREKFNKSKKVSQERVGKPRPFQDVQARYLSPRPAARVPRSTSSDSSTRDCLAGHSRPRTAAPSSDSLPAPHNKYATFTKTVHSKSATLPEPDPVRKAGHTNAVKTPYKSKIPTYVNHHKSNPSSATTSTRKIHEKSTKSSKAKVVSKVVKETENTKVAGKHEKKVKGKQVPSTEAKEIKDIPVMERSGTFLKDDAMFRDFEQHDIDNDY